MDAGAWANQILTQVPDRAHFLLLLTLRALDRCADADVAVLRKNWKTRRRRFLH